MENAPQHEAPSVTAKGWKRALDCLMVLLLPLLMAYALVGGAAHEWLGTVMFLLFLGHHGLNWRWYPALLKGRWTVARVVPDGGQRSAALGHAGADGQRGDAVPVRVLLSSPARWSEVCPDAPYAVLLLGLLPDGPAPGPPLADGHGMGRKAGRCAPRAAERRGAAGGGIRRVRFLQAGGVAVSFFAQPLCVLRLQRTAVDVSAGLYRRVGRVRLAGPLRGPAASGGWPNI